MTTKQTRQRYRLQSKCKQQGLRYDSHCRTLFVAEGAQLTDKQKKTIERLAGGHGFVIQSEIPQ